MRKVIIVAALAALCVPAAVHAAKWWLPYPLDYKVVIIDNADAPLKISQAEIKYDSKGYGLLSKDTGVYELWIKAKYENVSTKEIIAAELRGVVFDYFDDRIYTVSCHAIEKLKPGKGGEGTWSYNFEGDFSSYTLIFYVSAARFADEKVWKADEEFILAEIKRIRGEEFAADVLEVE